MKTLHRPVKYDLLLDRCFSSVVHWCFMKEDSVDLFATSMKEGSIDLFATSIEEDFVDILDSTFAIKSAVASATAYMLLNTTEYTPRRYYTDILVCFCLITIMCEPEKKPHLAYFQTTHSLVQRIC